MQELTLPEGFGQAIQSKNGYWSIKDGERTWINLGKEDRPRRVRSWPRKMGKHASKERFTNHPGISEIATQEAEREEAYEALTIFVRNLKIEG